MLLRQRSREDINYERYDSEEAAVSFFALWKGDWKIERTAAVIYL